MRIYLDDNMASPVLLKLLTNAGHDVQAPSDVGMTGKPDPIHLAHAIAQGRVCLTGDHDDFQDLHFLVQASQGRHPGILVVRYDNDPTRDLTPKGMVAAIRKLEAAGVPMQNEYVVLNHWR